MVLQGGETKMRSDPKKISKRGECSRMRDDALKYAPRGVDNFLSHCVLFKNSGICDQTCGRMRDHGERAFLPPCALSVTSDGAGLPIPGLGGSRWLRCPLQTCGGGPLRHTRVNRNSAFEGRTTNKDTHLSKSISKNLIIYIEILKKH